MSVAPVLFLIFNRPDTTARVMEAIRAAGPPRLYVAADGPRERLGEAELCEKARGIAKAVDWACEVKMLFRSHNLGCGEAVSSAITWFFENEEEGIILEDDCLPSPDFFEFCEQLLGRYRSEAKVMAICGSSYATPGSGYKASYYFSYYADVWGWATWRRAWQHYDRSLSRWPQFKERGAIVNISSGRTWHESYWRNLFDRTWEGRIDTWDYQWIFTVIDRGGLACYPNQNLVSNLGFRPDATHTIARYPENYASWAGNRPHQPLRYPLIHPTSVQRTPEFDQEIEAKRLDLRPPASRWVNEVTRLKRAVRQLLGDATIGIIDYVRTPSRGAGWGGPFNGQPARQALFLRLMDEIRPRAIVETGTYLGTTTDFMAATGLPVYTAEVDRRNYGFVRARFWNRRNIICRSGDSRTVLKKLFDGPLRALAGETIFFYLDAHWNDDLPLAEELELVFNECSTAVVMIDDFEVPFDFGYGFDDYGTGKALTSLYIADAVSVHGLRAFYPSTPSVLEGGARRGCVILAKHPAQVSALSSLALLCADTFPVKDRPDALSHTR